MQSCTFYDILEIRPSVPTEEVRRAYRRKALATHPDKLDQNATENEKRRAENKFRRIREAFDVLGDPVKRQQYDAYLSSSKPNTSGWSDQLMKRMREREEWARMQEAQHRARMEALREQFGMKYAPRREKTEVPKEVQEIVDTINVAVNEARPGWLERLQKAQQFKAERAKQFGQRV